MELSLPTALPPEYRSDEIVRAHKLAQLYFATKDYNAMMAAIILCDGRKKKYPENPYALNLLGLFSVEFKNCEAAKALFAKAFSIDADFQAARDNLVSVMRENDGGEDVMGYLTIMGADEKNVADYHAYTAQRLLERGEIAEADRHLQKAVAILNPFLPPLEDYTAALASTKCLFNENTLAQVLEHVNPLSRPNDIHGTITSLPFEEYEDKSRTADRLNCAKIISNLLKEQTSSDVSCVDLGCFNGFMLSLVKKELGRSSEKTAHLYGIEPQPAPIAYCREFYPFINVLEGTSGDMMSGSLALPKKVDVFLAHTIFIMYHPKSVGEILAFLNGRAHYVVIGDDIVNLDGDMPVLRNRVNGEIPQEKRTSPPFVLHPYRKTFDEHGFAIEQVHFAEEPERGMTGYIVARNRHWQDA